MLAITSKAPCAVRALIELARRQGRGPVPIADIARRRGIPVQFLEGVFGALRRAGVLQSQRGVKGGYSFARPPEELTVLEVVLVLEGDLHIDGAEEGDVWSSAADALRGVLGGTTIADLAEREARAAGAAMYHI